MPESKLYFDLADIVAPAHTMLVVWDMQNMLIDRVFNKNEVLNSVAVLLQVSRKIKVPAVYTKITPLPARFQAPASVAQRMKRMGITDPKQMRPTFGDDPKAMEIAGEISPLGEDIILNKNTASIFMGTNFDYIARNGGIETLVFTGISTEIGIESSARDALVRGYYVVVVSDGVSSMNREAHDRSLANLGGLCEVVTHRDILNVWSPQNASG